jgi:hypothetical protein
MATLNAVYVRAVADDTAITEAIRAKFPNAAVEANSQFRGVTLPNEAFEAPEGDLMELSSRLKTDVLWLSFQSTVDAFQFHHWRAGQRLRSLVYGCFVNERMWERAEGMSEPWERDVFFDQEALKLGLQYLKGDDAKREMERIWREAEIQPGRTEPMLDGRECARKVAVHFGLPGWGL